MPNLNSAVEAVLSSHEALQEFEDALITEWRGGKKPTDGSSQFPYPVYSEPLEIFIDSVVNLVSRWTLAIGDYQEASRHYVADHDKIRNASPEDIKAILTYIWRGERFCDGFWAETISSGLVAATLARLRDLYRSSVIGEN